MTTTATTLPLSQLVVSPKNVRQNPGDVTALAASIAAVGLLQNLVVSPTENGTYQVDAGGRRFAALTLLASEGKIAADAPVPVLVIDANDSTTASLTENVQRENMHPAEEFDAFKKLNDEGMSIDRIADAFGVTPLVVERRLRLTAAAPEIIALFRANELTTDQVIALCATNDHAVQMAVWKSHGHSSYSSTPERLRTAVLQTEVQADRDPRVAFLGGIEAYENAGGVVRRDLFSTDGKAAILENPALLDQLVTEKLEIEAEAIRAEGWGWVEVWAEWDWQAADRLGRVNATVRALTEEEEKRIASLHAEQEALNSEWEALNEKEGALIDADRDRLAFIERRVGDGNDGGEIDAEIGSIKQSVKTYAPEVMALAGAVVSLRGGKLSIERGRLRTADRKAFEALNTGERINGGRETESAGRKTDAMSEALRRSLLGHRNLAAQRVAASNVQVMKVMQAVWTVNFLRNNSTSYSPNPAPTVLTLSSTLPGTRNGYTITDQQGSDSADAFPEECKEAVAHLPKAQEALWDALAAAKSAELDKIIALGCALSLSLAHDHKGLTGKLLEALGFDMAEHFQPTADNYLGKLPKPLMIEALTEAKQVKDAAEKEMLLGMKKGALAAEAEKRLAGSGWVPKLIRTPKAKAKADAKPKPETKAKPAPKGKAPAKSKAPAKAGAEAAQPAA
jgi:ParB family transcriptional regulator, chromosome partitioning protein